jgi:hypothetical protein
MAVSVGGAGGMSQGLRVLVLAVSAKGESDSPASLCTPGFISPASLCTPGFTIG